MSRDLSAYELHCGYVQMHETPQEHVSLYADEHHTCYWVYHYRAGYAGRGYVNYKQSYHTLANARDAYHRIVADIKETNHAAI